MNETVKPYVGEEEFQRLFIDHPLFHMDKSSFSLEIEKMAQEKKINYFEAACLLCEKYDIEYSKIPKLLTQTMLEKIEVDASELHLLKKKKK